MRELDIHTLDVLIAITVFFSQRKSTGVTVVPYCLRIDGIEIKVGFLYFFFCRDTLPNYVFLDMLTILSRMSHAMAASIRSESKLSEKSLSMIDLATESFRSLRNSCAGCKKNQEECLR